MTKKNYIQPVIEVTTAIVEQNLMTASNPWKDEIIKADETIPQF